MNQVSKSCEIDRLIKYLRGTGGDSTPHDGGISIERRIDYHWDISSRWVGLYTLGCFVSVNPRQPDIHQDEVRMEGESSVYSLESGTCFDNVVTSALDYLDDQFPAVIIVFNDQHLLLAIHEAKLSINGASDVYRNWTLPKTNKNEFKGVCGNLQALQLPI
jgi:hypothetical protein